ncbi:MAG: RluA family pseudouridine synthase [Opitutaceae bacterium]|nr:RluA family pseudouridine synthase [Opitutaceae bacterium]
MPPPIAILHEDEHLLALNKPSGLLTEGGGDREDDLEQVARRLTGKPCRACHRLDRLTSGVVLLRKNNRHNAALAALFAEHRIRKLYWALVAGRWPAGLNKIETRIAPAGPGRWANVPAGGQPAVTTCRILGRAPADTVTWLELLLKTGRTHQARLHCLHAGHPVLGDPLYGPGAQADFFGLHARELRFRHPATAAELTVVAPPPAAWAATLESCRA